MSGVEGGGGNRARSFPHGSLDYDDQQVLREKEEGKITPLPMDHYTDTSKEDQQEQRVAEVLSEVGRINLI